MSKHNSHGKFLLLKSAFRSKCAKKLKRKGRAKKQSAKRKGGLKTKLPINLAVDDRHSFVIFTARQSVEKAVANDRAVVVF